MYGHIAYQEDMMAALETAVMAYQEGMFEAALGGATEDWVKLVFLAVEAKAKAGSEGRSDAELTQVGERQLRDAIWCAGQFLKENRLDFEISSTKEMWATLMYRALKAWVEAKPLALQLRLQTQHYVFYDVLRICREDIATIIGEDEANRLTSEDLEQIAICTRDVLLNVCFWDVLKERVSLHLQAEEPEMEGKWDAYEEEARLRLQAREEVTEDGQPTLIQMRPLVVTTDGWDAWEDEDDEYDPWADENDGWG